MGDVAAQTTRNSLVSQYNNIMQQITTTAQDASFNGVNLLNGDQIKLVFNETGKSTLACSARRSTRRASAWPNLTSGVDFIDNASTNSSMANLKTFNQRRCALSFDPRFEPLDRADPSGLLEEPDQRAADRLVGHLTLAVTIVEAANSRALSTRQSRSRCSALSLANQSQQSVLQLLADLSEKLLRRAAETRHLYWAYRSRD